MVLANVFDQKSLISDNGMIWLTKISLETGFNTQNIFKFPATLLPIHTKLFLVKLKSALADEFYFFFSSQSCLVLMFRREMDYLFH